MLNQFLLSLPMTICLLWGIFFLIRLFSRPKEPSVLVFLVLFFTFSTLLYTDHWLYFSNYKTTFGSFSYLFANLSVYPLYYLYIQALTRKWHVWEAVLLFVPTVLMAILIPCCVAYGWPEKASLVLFTRLSFAVQALAVWMRGFQLIRAARRRMDNIYSDDRSRSLQPINILQHVLGITVGFSSVLNILGREIFRHEVPVAIPAIVMSILLFGIGYIAAHTSVPKETVEEEPVPMKDNSSAEEADELIRRIDALMQEKKLYTNAGLTIQDLAAAVNSNRTYVSNCINRTYGINFSQYVSRQRVAHAQRLLRDPRYKTDHDAVADAIALSGFSSDQTFYRTFKEVCGTTPLKYRKTSSNY